METIKPSKILGFVLIVFAFLALIMFVFPKDGIPITDTFKLKFITFNQLFGRDTVKYADIDSVLAAGQDSTILKELTSINDSIVAFKKFAAQNPRRIFYQNDDHSVLFPLFEALEKAEQSGAALHILHYGDSQIEMDRISGYIREQLQQKFGGCGPGLQPAYQVIDATHVRQVSSGNFNRYAAWGKEDSTTGPLRVSHGRYGIMYNFCEVAGGGSITFSEASQSYEKAKRVERVRMLVGDIEESFTANVSVDGKEMEAKTLPGGTDYAMLEWDIPTTTGGKIKVSFSGGGTPEIYGISLDGKTGVAFDNMPMRGCSGTIFTRGDSTLLAKSLESLNVKLIIFQFGGNMMPSISGPESAKEYGEKFYKQLKYIRNIRPDVSILTIGLADMAKKQDGKMQSYPYISEVRDALKKATFDAGGAYWDMFEMMGGLNSMPGWVDKKLAGSDYIHFTTKGAQQVSEWFYEALMNDYTVYRLEKRQKEINAQQEEKSSFLPQ